MTTRMSRRFVHILILFSLVTTATLRAQAVHWDPARGTLAVGQTTELQLVFDDCTPEENIRIPAVDGLTLQPLGRTTATSFINFVRSDTITVNYGVLLTKKQRVTIPPFEVTTNKGKVRTPPAIFEAGEATVGSSGVALENVASGRLSTAPTSVWAGEVFSVRYTIDISHTYVPDFGRGAIEWNAEPLVAEDWGRPELYSPGNSSDARDGLSYRTRAIARTPGSTRLNAVHQLVNLAVGVTGFGFFQQRQFQQFSITSSAPILEVKPLPPAPAGFTGAVGTLKLSSKVVPSTAAVGEPVTWTLELTGTANWPDVTGLPPRDVSKDFQIVSPQAKRTPVEGKLFEASLAEDVVLVPTKAGTYTLGPLTFAYFDPKLGTYQTITTAPATVTITPAATPAVSPPPASTLAPTEEPKTQAPKPQAPPPPATLPRDPLPGAEVVGVPLETRPLMLLLLAPLVPLLLFWLWLALKRARANDPFRARRAAENRLAALLPQIRPKDSPLSTLRSQLLQWQRDTTVLLEIPHAAPTPASLAKLQIQNTALQTLWSESDRALYGENAALPADWVPRAQAVLAATPVPRFSALRLFRGHNLFPFVALVLVAALAAPVIRAADAVAPETQTAKPKTRNSADTAAAYRRGDFAAAEESWRAVLAATPTDAIARHNLSLALAQQDRWDEAAAQAAAAFVQSPASEPVRAQFSLAAEKSGHVPAPLAAFLTPGPAESLARLASPTCWQYTLCAATLLAALALAFMLHRAYAAKAIWPAFVLLAASIALALGALLGWRLYGFASDTRAVIVWRAGTLRSIPTEADTAQKTSLLAAGTLGVADRDFLGWRHLTFEAGQAGWVRSDEVVALWK